MMRSVGLVVLLLLVPAALDAQRDSRAPGDAEIAALYPALEGLYVDLHKNLKIDGYRGSRASLCGVGT
jgi:hypothetical protein